MIDIKILEPHDRLLLTDWCRPLQLQTMSGGHSDDYSFESCYGGYPENNTKWVQAKYLFGDIMENKTIWEINETRSSGWHEFARGDIPLYHQYGPTQEDKRKSYDNYLLTTAAKVGKHKGDLWFTIMHQRPDYFQWAESVGMVVDKKTHYSTMDAQWLKLVEKDYLKKSLLNGDK